MTLPASLTELLNKRAYPHPCGNIELVETHISWVLLTGDFAYKLKKPLRFAFLDFSTLKLREHFCREELRCNTAFAPDLYIAVVPVCSRSDGGICIGGAPDSGGTVVEWAVQMRQFDPALQLDHLLAQNRVTADMLRAFGCALARVHALLPRLQTAADELDERIVAPVRDNFTEILATGLRQKHAARIARTQQLSQRLGEALRPQIEVRMANGFVRECHGDLHLSNLVLRNGAVVAFDCLEFNEQLRWIDTISDVAFLLMDCDERGRPDLAYAFLSGYLDESGDYRGAELLGYFAAYRSVVRAKVAALRWDQERTPDAENRFVQHMDWALTRLERPPGQLVLMCGLSGSGKSCVARQLATALPAVQLRSDVARKTLAGLHARDRTASPVGGGLYAPDRSEEVYAFLRETAVALARRGEHVIVDATFLARVQRAAFLQAARENRLTAHIVYCEAPAELLRARIAQRARTGDDPSEATEDVLAAQLANFRAPGSDEPVIRLATVQSVTMTDLRHQLAALFASAGPAVRD